MKISHCAKLLLLLLGIATANATERTLTNQDGASIDAELVELKDKNGKEVLAFKRTSDNRAFEIELSTLSFEDQRAVRAWWKQELIDRSVLKSSQKLDISFKYNRKKESLDNNYYSDDDRYYFTPEVIIENDDLYNSFSDNTVRIVCFAEHTYYKGTLEVVSVSEKKFDLPRNGATTVSGNRYTFTNYESDYSNYEYGWEQAGYALVIKNSKGEITHTDASNKKFLQEMDTVMKCRVDDYYTTDLSIKRSGYSR